MTWPRAASRDDTELHVELPAAQPGAVAAVLCDGMGGHAGGALASRLACEHFLPALLSGDAPLGARLMVALDAANTAIARQTEGNPAYSGMGSTLVGVYADETGLCWISVGDSLLYLVRERELSTLNADHSLAPEIDKLAETGKISWAAARSDPRRHYLRSALTGDELEMIDLSDEPIRLQAGDVLVLASDGIHTLEPEAIAAIVASDDGCDPGRIASRLIAAVDDAGVAHQDNTTLVVIAVSGSESGA